METLKQKWNELCAEKSVKIPFPIRINGKFVFPDSEFPDKETYDDFMSLYDKMVSQLKTDKLSFFDRISAIAPKKAEKLIPYDIILVVFTHGIYPRPVLFNIDGSIQLITATECGVMNYEKVNTFRDELSEIINQNSTGKPENIAERICDALSKRPLYDVSKLSNEPETREKVSAYVKSKKWVPTKPSTFFLNKKFSVHKSEEHLPKLVIMSGREKGRDIFDDVHSFTGKKERHIYLSDIIGYLKSNKFSRFLIFDCSCNIIDKRISKEEQDLLLDLQSAINNGDEVKLIPYVKMYAGKRFKHTQRIHRDVHRLSRTRLDKDVKRRKQTTRFRRRKF